MKNQYLLIIAIVFFTQLNTSFAHERHRTNSELMQDLQDCKKALDYFHPKYTKKIIQSCEKNVSYQGSVSDAITFFEQRWQGGLLVKPGTKLESFLQEIKDTPSSKLTLFQKHEIKMLMIIGRKIKYQVELDVIQKLRDELNAHLTE